MATEAAMTAASGVRRALRWRGPFAPSALSRLTARHEIYDALVALPRARDDGAEGAGAVPGQVAAGRAGLAHVGRLRPEPGGRGAGRQWGDARML